MERMILIVILSMFASMASGVTTTPACRNLGAGFFSPIEMVSADIAILQSPNYPANYNPWTNCGWNVVCNGGGFDSALKIECDDNFVLEDRFLGSCSADKLVIQYLPAFLGNRFCGTTKPPTIITGSGSANFLFHSNHVNQFAGFKCTLTCNTKAAFQG